MGHPPCWVLGREQARDMILINKELTVLCESWGKCTYKFTTYIKASLVAQLVKNPPALQETPVRFLCWKDPLEKA